MSSKEPTTRGIKNPQHVICQQTVLKLARWQVVAEVGFFGTWDFQKRKRSIGNTALYFQFKVTHGFYPTNAYLKKVKIQETNLCANCEIEDTLEHYFVTCRTTQTLWEQMKNLINPMSCLSNTQILFGVLKTDKLSLTVNWANLILKYYIHAFLQM